MKALLIIDVQDGMDQWDYYGENRSNPGAEIRMQTILIKWRKSNWPVIHIKHDSTDPDSPLYPGKDGNKIKQIVAPAEGEPVISKQTNSAFIGTDLESRLRSLGIEELTLIGLTVEHCVSSTARMASDLGFNVKVVAKATVAFAKRGPSGTIHEAQLVHDLALANLENEFAEIVQTEQII